MRPTYTIQSWWGVAGTAFGLLILVSGSSGCSKHPTDLLRKIQSADQVVATSGQPGLGSTFTGDDVRRIVQAIATAERDRKNYDAMFDWHFEFYSGKNLLADIRVQDTVFRTETAQYIDNTGVVRDFYFRAVETNRLKPPLGR